MRHPRYGAWHPTVLMHQGELATEQGEAALLHRKDDGWFAVVQALLKEQRHGGVPGPLDYGMHGRQSKGRVNVENSCFTVATQRARLPGVDDSSKLSSASPARSAICCSYDDSTGMARQLVSNSAHCRTVRHGALRTSFQCASARHTTAVRERPRPPASPPLVFRYAPHSGVLTIDRTFASNSRYAPRAFAPAAEIAGQTVQVPIGSLTLSAIIAQPRHVADKGGVRHNDVTAAADVHRQPHFVAQRPGKRHRRAPRAPLQRLQRGAARRACRWGSAMRPRGGATRPLMSRSAERRTAGGPQARSRRDRSAAHPEGGRPTGPSTHRRHRLHRAGSPLLGVAASEPPAMNPGENFANATLKVDASSAQLAQSRRTLAIAPHAGYATRYRRTSIHIASEPYSPCRASGSRRRAQ